MVMDVCQDNLMMTADAKEKSIHQPRHMLEQHQ